MVDGYGEADTLPVTAVNAPLLRFLRLRVGRTPPPNSSQVAATVIALQNRLPRARVVRPSTHPPPTHPPPAVVPAPPLPSGPLSIYNVSSRPSVSFRPYVSFRPGVLQRDGRVRDCEHGVHDAIGVLG